MICYYLGSLSHQEVSELGGWENGRAGSGHVHMEISSVCVCDMIRAQIAATCAPQFGGAAPQAHLALVCCATMHSQFCVCLRVAQADQEKEVKQLRAQVAKLEEEMRRAVQSGQSDAQTISRQVCIGATVSGQMLQGVCTIVASLLMWPAV